MTDKELFQLCRKYGSRALEWRRKFIGLLPEVDRRRLWEKKGFGSIYEFAAKLCGVSKDQVRLAVNLDRRFEDKPCLKEALIEGEVSINKLARVVSIATPENEEELAEQVKALPQKAVEVLVKDIVTENGLLQPRSERESLRAQTLELSEEVQGKLLGLKEKGLDVNEILLELLEKREMDIQEEKQEIAASLPQTNSRYKPVGVMRVLQKEYGTKCAVPGCNRDAKEIHHTARFSLTKQHNPLFMAPLCKEHHAIAHAVDGKVLEKRFG